MATQQVHPMQVLHRGAKSDAARALQAATNRRLQRRGLAEVAIDEDGVVGAKTMAAVTAAAWALGARRETIARMDGGEIPIGVQRMIRNPGRRTDEQKALGKKRVAHMLAARRAARGRRGAGGLGPQARRPGRPAGGGQLPRDARGLPLPRRRPGQRGLPGADPERLALGLLAVRRGGLQGGRPAVPGDRRARVRRHVEHRPEGPRHDQPAPGRPRDVRHARRLHPSRRAVLRRAGTGVRRPRIRADRLGRRRAGPTTT